MDLDKIKRIIPDLISKVKNKVFPAQSSTAVKDDKKRETTSYEYLPNDEVYKSKHVYEKIWYLRGRFDWFNSKANKNYIAADASVGMLDEIVQELESLAFSNLEHCLEIFNLRNNVYTYYERYTYDANCEDVFDYDFPQDEYGKPKTMPTNIFDEIWILRSLYDSAVEKGNNEGIKSAKLWLKSIIAKCEGEELIAMKNIYSSFKQLAKIKNDDHYDYED